MPTYWTAVAWKPITIPALRATAAFAELSLAAIDGLGVHPMGANVSGPGPAAALTSIVPVRVGTAGAASPIAVLTVAPTPLSAAALLPSPVTTLNTTVAVPPLGAVANTPAPGAGPVAVPGRQVNVSVSRSSTI